MKKAIQTWLSTSAIPRPALFIGFATPLAILLWDVWSEVQVPGSGLGANPTEAIIKRLGEDGINVLLLTLGFSSIARLVRIPQLIRFRRMVGLWAFTYLVLHLTAYFVFLAGREWSTFIADLGKRPYIFAGMAGVTLLLPLAITSTRGWQRRLARHWKTLHMLIYPAAVAGWIHVFWQSRASYSDAVLYGSLVLLLFSERVVDRIRKWRRSAQRKQGRLESY